MAGLAGLAVLVSTLATPALAEPREWDQKAVTALAVQLEKSLKDLSVTVRKAPSEPLGSPKRRAQYQAREDLKFLVSVSKRLAAQLQAGDDRDATLPTYRRLQTIRRDTAESARKANIAAPTLERVVSSRAILEQLEPYYEESGTPTNAPALESPNP
jgi:hypothetical protein